MVHGVDKFPRMTDFVSPPGVRIADASRVRLGAYLAEGTVVMHEGFVNFNAGTLGPAMVEGRITAGSVVDSDSDLGAGSSILGTLSGGGTNLIRIGKRCLLGANSGTGISLGDDCAIEAGLYVTRGTLVTLPDGQVVKAAELSGTPESCSGGIACTATWRRCRGSRTPSPVSIPSCTISSSDKEVVLDFVLVHSPLVGPSTWRWVAQELNTAGHRASVRAVPAAVAEQGWSAFADSMARQAAGGEMLVGHSGAGPLLPQIPSAPRGRRPGWFSWTRLCRRRPAPSS